MRPIRARNTGGQKWVWVRGMLMSLAFATRVSSQREDTFTPLLFWSLWWWNYASNVCRRPVSRRFWINIKFIEGDLQSFLGELSLPSGCSHALPKFFFFLVEKLNWNNVVRHAGEVALPILGKTCGWWWWCFGGLPALGLLCQGLCSANGCEGCFYGILDDWFIFLTCLL